MTVLDELRKGIERLRPREPLRAETLSRWLDDVTECWGMMAATRPVPVTDGFLAATAKVHGLVLVTRNTRGVAGLGAEVLDPFAAVEARGSGV